MYVCVYACADRHIIVKRIKFIPWLVWSVSGDAQGTGTTNGALRSPVCQITANSRYLKLAANNKDELKLPRYTSLLSLTCGNNLKVFLRIASRSFISFEARNPKHHTIRTSRPLKE